MINIITLLISFLVIITSQNCLADFSYSIKNPGDDDAQTYIVQKSNVSLRSEGDFTYWHPKVGGETMEESPPGVIIFHFPLQDPIAKATLIATSTAFNWSYSQGHTFIYVSTDGDDWIKITEASRPEYGGYRAGSFSGLLPEIFNGKTNIYVKTELYSYGSGASNGGAQTNTAQFLRYSSSQDSISLKLDVTFDTDIPTSDDPMVSESTPLTVTVNGRDVILDWSLMPDAKNYTLYYALTDFKGDIDAASLGSVEMGIEKNISIPNLPSGLIIYAGILAYTNQGEVLSNIVKFMPFGGSAEYPQTGNILMQINDQGGIGSIEVMGTRNADGSDNLISRITRTDNTGMHVLYLTDNKPSSYEGEKFLLNFKYRDDGSVGYEVVNTSKNFPRKKASDTICTQYETVDEYISASYSIISHLVYERLDDQEYRIGPVMKTLDTVYIVLFEKALKSEYYMNYIRMHPSADRITFLHTDPNFYKLQKIYNMMELINKSTKSYGEMFIEIRQSYIDHYNDKCAGVPSDDTPTCPITYDASRDNDNDGVSSGYWVNSTKCRYELSLRPFYLRYEYPYVNEKVNGIAKKYNTYGPAAGKIKSKQEYADGEKVGYTSSYEYNDSGQLTGCKLWDSGIFKGNCSQ